MAQIIEISDSTELKQIVNVTESVGKSGINYQNDVMVVKALLWYVLANFPEVAPPGGVPLPFDGTVKGLSTAITKFQKWFNEQNRKAALTVDGRVNTMRGSSKFVTGTSRYRTIFALNLYAELKARQEGADGLTAINKLFPHLKFILFPESSDSIN